MPRNKIVTIADKNITVEEKKIGELEKLVAVLFPKSKGKLSNVNLEDLGDIDFDLLYKKLPIIFPELTEDDVKNAYMSELEHWPGVY